jgi:Spy/CpxP family protein refolding chaperone
MKVRTGLITAVLLMASAATWAQAPAPGHHGRMDMDRLEVLLELDAYQKQEVQKIFDARREARREKRSQLRDAGKQTREQLAKVLSEEQLKKLDALMEFDRPHPPRRRVR